jgi:SHS2 domain-containing protein
VLISEKSRRRSNFRFLANIALADIAFVSRGDSLPSLFEAAARALTEVMVDRTTLTGQVKRKIELSSPTIDRLLYDFLTELIVIKDVDSLLFKDFKVSIVSSAKGEKKLTCDTRGEEIDRERHALRNDVKAVTMHMFGVRKPRKKGDRWEATIVLDI